MAANAPYLTIHASTSGEIRVSGTVTSLEQLDKQLAPLAEQCGVVWYYREAPLDKPHANAISVIELVVKHKIPISMSSKPDFTDYIDENGQSRPRK